MGSYCASPSARCIGRNPGAIMWLDEQPPQSDMLSAAPGNVALAAAYVQLAKWHVSAKPPKHPKKYHGRIGTTPGPPHLICCLFSRGTIN